MGTAKYNFKKSKFQLYVLKNMFITNLFYLAVFATKCLNFCSGIRTIPEEINFQISEETTIKSPGYPEKNYERDTTYIWMVTAPDVTEEISIRIEMDVHYTPGYPCDDYLQIQEINDYYFTLFKQCGKRTTYRIARGNKLRITLFSNHDRFTDKGFQLSLKVSKISTSLSKSTIGSSSMSKTSMAKEKTTTMKTEDPQRPNIGNKEIILSTRTAPITEVTARKTRKIKISTVFSSWKATKSTTPKVIVSEVLSSTPVLYTSSPIPHSTATTDETSKTTPVKRVLISTDSKNTSTMSQDKPQSSNTEPNAEISTQFIPMSKGSSHNQDLGSLQSATSPSISSSIKLSTETTTTESILMSTAESIPMSTTESMPMSSTESIPMSTTESIPIEILMMGIGVVEVTIIIVGILAVKRFREQRKSSMKRTSKEANDRRPVSRKTIFGIDNVYDTIPFDESDENPYKDLSDGVYDTTSKRRSHVNRQRSNYSRGSFFLHLFHKSNHNERKSIEENIPLPLRKETIEKV